MGEIYMDALRLRFGRKVRLAFDGAKVAGDGGLLVYRDLDHAISLSSFY